MGLEPTTRGLKGLCSNQLSYGPAPEWPIDFCNVLDVTLLQSLGILPFDRTNSLEASDCFVGGAGAPRAAKQGVLLPKQ